VRVDRSARLHRSTAIAHAFFVREYVSAGTLIDYAAIAFRFLRQPSRPNAKDVEATATNIPLERMSTSELEALIERYRDVGQDPLEAEKDPEEVFRVG
jgi:hypothetical protein